MSKFQIGDDRNLGIIFIHSALDDYGLDPFEFRIYCHIARREGLTDDIETIAARCKIDDLESVKKALNSLDRKGLISIKEAAHSGAITLNDCKDWKPCDRRKR